MRIEQRTWILVTSDGLPYKSIIERIKNFICCECGENIKFTSEMKEHKDKTSNTKFYQKYHNVILNILPLLPGEALLQKKQKHYTLKVQRRRSYCPNVQLSSTSKSFEQ